ncbi:MAG: hypothetical protein M1828_006925 [Chrysothrix sp. TS-e1954]|nr:MAG: hypothetical protein M1828_006925 [Chrysothrix sp. TS-e1954]
MKSLNFSFLITLASFVIKLCCAQTSFSGANNYYIHGLLNDTVGVNEWAADLASYGATLIRLWVTGTGGYQKGNLTNNIPDIEPTLGTYDDTVLEALDTVLSILSTNHLKAIIMPHDGNQLDPSGVGKCDAYCESYGAVGFYSNTPNNTLAPTLASPFDAYAARLEHILNYTSPTFGKPWAELDEVIYAFDIQNEAFIANEQTKALAVANDQAGWTCKTATVMRSLLADGIHITTGGIVNGEDADDGFAILDAALTCDAIDIYAFHGFTTAAEWQSLFIQGNATQTGNKGILVEEWGSQTGHWDFNDISAIFNDNGIPWLYWEVTPGPDDSSQCEEIVQRDYSITTVDPTFAGLLNECQVSFDANELGGYNNANLTALSGAMQAAATATLNPSAAPTP